MIEIYVSCPFRDANETTMTLRAAAATLYTTHLWAHGYRAFSPLTHNHALIRTAVGERLHVRADQRGFLEMNSAILPSALKVHLLELPGWQESCGVAAEIDEARRRSIEIKVIPADELAGLSEALRGTVEKLRRRDAVGE